MLHFKDIKPGKILNKSKRQFSKKILRINKFFFNKIRKIKKNHKLEKNKRIWKILIKILRILKKNNENFNNCKEFS